MRKSGTVLVLAAIVAVLILAPVAWAADVQGKIKAVDPSPKGHMVTLDDGTKLVIPAALKIQRQDLRPGANVKASFEEQNGQKVATSIQLMPAQ